MELASTQIPWPGPKPYDESDWELFFGRDRDIDVIAQKLATEQLTVLLGASGSGKTSLIRAGLVPLLRNRRYHPSSVVDEGPVLVFRAWGARSNDTLRDLMEQQLDNALDAITAWHNKYPEQLGAAEDVRKLKEVLVDHKGKDVVPIIEALAQAVANRAPTGRPKSSAQRAPLILVFDQLEELLRSRDTRSERETGKLGAEILALIGALYVRDSPLRMLISMRVEYLHALRPLDRSVARLSERCHYLEAMNTDDAREVVTLVSESPGVIRVDYDIVEEILKRDPSAGAESNADLLRLQAVLYALSSHARRHGLPAVDRQVYDRYRATMRGNEDVFQTAVEEWIESAVSGEVDSGGTRQSIEIAQKIRTWTNLADEDLLGQVRRIATRMAPHLSSSDYKVPQELNNLFRRALGQVLVTLAPEKANSLETVTIDFDFLAPDAKAPSVKWGAVDGEPESAQSDQHTSGTARTHRWSAAKTADVIATCYLLTLQRLEERNILRRTFSARNEIVCELVHDQMGPMLMRWAEKLQGGWWDCVSSLVALSGGHPISTQDDLIRGARFVDLTWRGCTIQPRSERLTFESAVFDRCELRGIVFDRCTFRGVEFNDCALNGAIFRDCIFEPGPDGARSVLIRDSRESALDCLLFLKCVIINVEFRNCIVRQPSFVASTLNGDVVFENCAVAQLYASKLKGREDARIRIPGGSKAWCCSADAKSYSMLDVDAADWGRLTTAEPNNFVPRPPADPS
ncbi:MAG TPA: pentapeptide repeat-containing protein [Thermoanaerobaculia bacterium]|nr:pentapeptide repeat-containing protein [Thermoanaerobaculia bacterium]